MTKFLIKNKKENCNFYDCVSLGIFKSKEIIGINMLENFSDQKFLFNIIKSKKEFWKIGNVSEFYYRSNNIFVNFLLVGCGKKNEITLSNYIEICKLVSKHFKNTAIKNISFFVSELNVLNINSYLKVRLAIEIVQDSLYSFNLFKEKYIKNNKKKIFFFKSKRDSDVETGIEHGTVISEGVRLSKNLSNMPPNIGNSYFLSKEAKKLSKQFKNINVTLIKEDEMQDLNMNAYLAVGKGSKNESIMSVIEYNKNSEQLRPIVLVGKGLTFDSGGISIKPSNKMDEMKYDMCGAACVYGLMYISASLKLPIHVIGIMACCENMPSGNSYRPGDVVQTMSGKTVEVINTDAEGRLVLCDVLTYVKRFNPEIVIDIATLTGACVVALGNQYHGLMSNDDELVKEILIASNQTKDEVWRLPISKEFNKKLQSNFADMSNSESGYSGGASIAGCFLSNFTKEYRWAHLDIAGTAWNSGIQKSATGRPLYLLTQFLLNYSKKIIF
ncbi:hypothetical protein AOQ88_00875 [Candidatus Riesia sp. GBBU]|nr:hypothetical protein AOQ88_00875 [Candidatus Riesia sp. GBBU]